MIDYKSLKQFHTDKSQKKQKPEVSTSAKVVRAPGASGKSKPTGGYRQKVPTKLCSGKCCFRCGKGHFVRDCDARGSCLHISEARLACEDKDHARYECECGQHRHFLNAGDREAAMLAVEPPKAKT